MDRRGNHFLCGADRSVADRPPMAAEMDTSTHVTESDAEVSMRLPSVPGFAPSDCTSSSTDGASGSRAARLTLPRPTMPARRKAKSLPSVSPWIGSTLTESSSAAKGLFRSATTLHAAPYANAAMKALAAVTTWLLLGSDVDEVLACFLLIATSLSFTLALLQLLRAVAAPKLVAVGPERIRAHMATIFF